jgi:mannose-6-phosphate isomerase-like protein (cupin superfamily)
LIQPVPFHPKERENRIMPKLIDQPVIIKAEGNKPKRIEEYAGRVSTGHQNVSIARMRSPEGWKEPGQRPEFEEVSVVLSGMLHVEYEGGTLDVRAGQSVVTQPGEWVCYSTPDPGGAEYIAVCLPAFSPKTVNRDPDQ